MELDEWENPQIEENVEGALIAKLSVIDQDPGDVYDLVLEKKSWQDQAWFDKFEIVGDELRLKPGVSFDYENSSWNALTIKATAQNGDEIQRDVSIDVVDVNEAPHFELPADLQVGEHSTHDSLFSIDVTDPEWEDEITIALSGADAAAFEYDGWSSINLRSGADFENPTDADGDNVYELTVSASDGVNTVEKSMTVEVQDENDQPEQLVLEAVAFDENVEGALVGTLSVKDQDAGDVYSFAINDDWYSDDRFEIVGNELRLKPGMALDYEASSQFDIYVTATAGNGDEISDYVDVAVTDVDEAPVLDLPSHIALGEHSGYLYEYFDVADPEGKALTISFSGADLEAFAIYSDTWGDGYGYGEFELTDWVDFEAPADADGDNVYELTVSVSDGVNTVDRTVEIEIEDENDYPEGIEFTSVPVKENVAGAVLGTISVIDQDAGDTHAFTLWDDRFEIVGDVLKLKDDVSLDFENYWSGVDIEVTDAAGAMIYDWVEIDLIDVNEAPILDIPAEFELAENMAVEEEIEAWDPDWDELTYELSGPDAELARFYPLDGFFEFVAPDFENPTDADGDGVYEITFSVTDGEFSASQDLRLTVTNANERPDAISLEQSSFEANAMGAVVGRVAASDPDAGDELAITVSDSRFEVVEGLLKLKATEMLDAATLNGLELELSATDAAGLSLTRSFTLEAEDPAHAPTALTLAKTAIAEGEAGTVIGQLTVTDPNAGDTHGFTVSDDRFEVVNGVLKLKAGVALDHEAGGAVSLDVTVTDSSGLKLTESFELQVGDMNEAPRALTLSNASVAENAAGAVIGQLSVTDPDAGDSHGFTLSDDRFEVVGGALKLKPGVALDHETAEAVQVTVTATDSGGLALAETFSVEVSNANDAPQGMVSLVGDVVAGATLVADPSDVSDADGLGAFAYQWLRDGVAIEGAEAQSYVLGAVDVDAMISVRVSYTDEGGTPETVTSEVTLPVAEAESEDAVQVGTAENDRLDGSDAEDVLWGRGGNDKLFGQGGDDVLHGEAGKDRLFGGAGSDEMFGGAGHDDLDGGAGADILAGGAGDDRYLLDDRMDRVVEEAGEGHDHVYAYTNVTLGKAEVEEVTLLGKADAWVTGNGGANAITGNAGNNVLIGGGGADELTGGKGADMFVFLEAEADATTTVTDLGGSDRLVFDDQLFGLGDGGLDLRSIDPMTALAALASGHVSYKRKSGEFWVDADGRGGDDAVLIAKLEDGPSLSLDQLMLF